MSVGQESSQISHRKDKHIAICLDENVDLYNSGSADLARWQFEHDALPEIDKNEIDLRVNFLGKSLKAPLVIGAMTGGTDRAREINVKLAKAAEKYGIAMALGSQRPMLVDAKSVSSFAVKEAAPGIPLLFGNLGAVQLNYGVTDAKVRWLIESVGADVLNLHLNPLQEAVQPEGDVNFSRLIEKIQALCQSCPHPLFLKEVGSGWSKQTLKKIKNLSIAGIETAGAGGTSWSKIESFRHENPIMQNVGLTFASWGHSAPMSVLNIREVLGNSLPVVGSGGLRNGIEAAKMIALGSDVVAMAMPFLKAAEVSEEMLHRAIEQVLEELKVTMFLTGARSLIELRQRALIRC